MPSTTDIAPYPKGVWTSMGSGSKVPAAVINNKGIVGLIVGEDWSDIEIGDGVYDWTSTDANIAAAKLAGFDNLILSINWSSWRTPPWLVSELNGKGKTLPLLDLGENHAAYCTPIDVPRIWNPRFHAKRLALIEAAGERYTADPAIIATYASFANQNSMDWNVQDKIGFYCDQNVDQPAQWLAANWTLKKVVNAGAEICDAVSVAFPNQNIKLPLGGFALPLADAPAGSGGVFSTAAIDIEAHVATQDSVPDYFDRFFIQRNTVSTNWKTADDLIQHPPQPASDRYIRKMVYDASPLSGLQTLTSEGNAQDLQTVIDIMLSFDTTFIELWIQDAKDPEFYEIIRDATIAMGGTPRP